MKLSFSSFIFISLILAPVAFAEKVVKSSTSYVAVATGVEEEDVGFRVIIQDEAAKQIYNAMTHVEVYSSSSRFDDLNQFENTKSSIGYMAVCTEHVSKWPNGEIFMSPSYVCTLQVPNGKVARD